VQPVKHPGSQKAGHGEATAFDQHPGQASGSQSLKHRCGMEPPARGDLVHLQNLHRPAGRRRLRAPALQPQGRGGSVLKHLPIRWNPAGWIQHHADRVVTAHMTHRQLRVVGNRGTSAHDHRIHQGPEAVQMLDVLGSGHEMRVAAVGGDAPVQRLPELCDHQFPGLDERQVDGVDLGAVTRRAFGPWLPDGRLLFFAAPECGEALEDRAPLPCIRTFVVHGTEPRCADGARSGTGRMGPGRA